MVQRPSLPAVNVRLLLASILLVSTVTVAGCSTNADYTTMVGEPSNGTVIDDLTVYDVNELDGVRYELQFSLAASDDAAYNIEVYENPSGTPEFVSISDLDRRDTPHRDDVPPPGEDGEKRVYELRVVHEADDSVVDSVTFAIERDGS